MDVKEIDVELSESDIKNVGFHLGGSTLGKITSDAVNAFGFDTKGYARVIEQTHPTLQQNWMRMTMETLRLLAKRAETGCYDDRNEATVMAAKKNGRCNGKRRVSVCLRLYCAAIKNKV